MLTGRESLVRLIGRCCHSPLPASLAVLLSSSSPSSTHHHQADDGKAGEAPTEAAAGSSPAESAGAGADGVACSVCGESSRRTDYCVNTHLDICLARGTKQNLTQSNLLDFRFSKKTTVEPTLDSLSNDEEAENTELIDAVVSSDRAFFSMNIDSGSSKDSATTLSPGCLHGSLDIPKTLNTCIPSCAVLLNLKNAENDDADEKGSSCMLPT